MSPEQQQWQRDRQTDMPPHHGIAHTKARSRERRGANIVRPQEAKLVSAIRNAHFPPRFLHTPLADLVSTWASLLENSAKAKIEQLEEIINNW